MNPLNKCANLKTLSNARYFGLSKSMSIPINPADRVPLTPHQQKLYPQVEQEFTDEGFPILKFKPKISRVFRTRVKNNLVPYEPINTVEQNMKEDQDWPSVWPVAAGFNPFKVPLPIRQSYEPKFHIVARGKYANTELMKGVNFLHLTPPAIERQCKAIKKFCTKWPVGLDTDEKVNFHFPVSFTTRDYVHSTSTIRDPRSRVVILEVKVADLKLQGADLDKLIRLARGRYDPEKGMLKIIADACPSKVQNRDYAEYLLTALYYESQRHEQWEDDKPEEDWERFYWEKSQSKEKVKQYCTPSIGNTIGDEVIESGSGHKVVENYKESLQKIFEAENVAALDAYRSSVEKLIGLH